MIVFFQASDLLIHCLVRPSHHRHHDFVLLHHLQSRQVEPQEVVDLDRPNNNDINNSNQS
jgi:hypothetical protein